MSLYRNEFFTVLPLFAIVTITAWFVVGWVKRNAQALNLIDHPNVRSSHVLPKPSGGGLGMVVAGGGAGIWLGCNDDSGWILHIALLSMLIALVGLWDDIRPLPVWPRLTVQAIGLLGVVWVSPDAISLVGFGLLLVGVWWVNLFNFMDGIDGLAGMQAGFMLSMAALLSYVTQSEVMLSPGWRWMLFIVAAVIGFLPWNWPPAKIFMGDVGSTWLGFLLFAFCLLSVQSGWLTYPVWLLLAALFVVDATVTLFSRLIRKNRLSEAHRSHAYQCLARRWGTHRAVTLAYFALNGLLACIAWLAMALPDYAWLCVALVYSTLSPMAIYVRNLDKCE